MLKNVQFLCSRSSDRGGGEGGWYTRKIWVPVFTEIWLGAGFPAASNLSWMTSIPMRLR